ncbi:MAG: putative Restriction endonuclease [Thermoleophilia bacterium]|nr:putative Restriction endonuclease [Thermoleophilia bacterium]
MLKAVDTDGVRRCWHARMLAPQGMYDVGMAYQHTKEARLELLLELGGGKCAWCGFDLSKPQARPTRDHIVPKIKGGPTRLENEVAACGSCNQQRGHASPSQFIEKSRSERLLEPDAALVADQLDRLDAAIATEGGMRKIRDYVTREARRCRELAGR